MRMHVAKATMAEVHTSAMVAAERAEAHKATVEMMVVIPMTHMAVMVTGHVAMMVTVEMMVPEAAALRVLMLADGAAADADGGAAADGGYAHGGGGADAEEGKGVRGGDAAEGNCTRRRWRRRR